MLFKLLGLYVEASFWRLVESLPIIHQAAGKLLLSHKCRYFRKMWCPIESNRSLTETGLETLSDRLLLPALDPDLPAIDREFQEMSALELSLYLLVWRRTNISIWLIAAFFVISLISAWSTWRKALKNLFWTNWLFESGFGHFVQVFENVDKFPQQLFWNLKSQIWNLKLVPASPD